MAENPYATPRGEVRDDAGELFSFSVAVIGMLIGSGAAYVLGIFYGNLAQWSMLSRGVALDALYNTVAGSHLFNVGGHLINIFAAAMGGYWAAKLRPMRATTHAAVAGGLMLAPVAVAWVTPYGMPHPMWSILLSFITPIPSALAGAYWWRRGA